MKYLCAVYLEPATMDALSTQEHAKLDRDSLSNDEQLRKQGKLIAAAALQPARTAKTVRSHGGKIATTDGPFAETKEVLGGFMFLEAGSLEEAVQIAENTPIAKYGSIEIREEMKIGQETAKSKARF